MSILENTPSFWLYAPGEGGKYWKEYYDAKIMAIGWNYLGDLKKYKTKEEIAQAMRAHEDADTAKTNNALSCYSFVNSMKIGDVIFAKIGRSRIIGMGVITSNYVFDKNRSNFKHVREVDWKISGEWIVSEDEQFAFKTITNVTEYPDFVNYLKKLVKFESLLKVNIENNKNGMIDLINRSKQIILYGPPGTGKTFLARKLALQILGQVESEPIHTELAKFDEIATEETSGRVWIFQSNPNQYDLRKELIENESKVDDWSVSQYKNQIKAGDLVLLWISGLESGIYAVARTLTDPAAGGHYFRGFGLKIKVEVNLVSNPVLKKELVAEPELKELSILRFFQATNFPVEPKEWKIIRKIINEHSGVSI